jgi:hypothetical protein
MIHLFVFVPWFAIDIKTKMSTSLNNYSTNSLSQEYVLFVPLYLSCGSISIFLCALIFFVWSRYPVIRTWPSSVILSLTMCDLLLSLKFFLGAVFYLVLPNSAISTKYSLNIINDNCLSSGMWFQVCAI